MSPEEMDLAKRLVERPTWRWRAGMLALASGRAVTRFDDRGRALP